MLFSLVQFINQYIEQINRYVDKKQKKEELVLVSTSVEIFLKFLDKKFKDEFWRQLNPILYPFRSSSTSLFRNTAHMRKYLQQLLEGFINVLGTKYKEYEKIFLSRDAYILFDMYSKQFKDKTAHEFLYTRKLLYGANNGDKYLRFTNLIYKGLNIKSDKKSFVETYIKNVQREKKSYEIIMRKTEQLLNKQSILKNTNKQKKILLIDSGIQAGLLLPLYMYLVSKGYAVDLCMFTGVRWLSNILTHRLYTKNIYVLPLLERQGEVVYSINHV